MFIRLYTLVALLLSIILDLPSVAWSEETDDTFGLWDIGNHILQDETHRCTDDTQFWDPGNDDKKWQEARAGEAYRNWIKKTIADNSIEWHHRDNEPDFFANQTLRWLGMSCHISDGGCKSAPSCDQVYSLVGPGKEELARRIWYITMAMNRINTFYSVLQVLVFSW